MKRYARRLLLTLALLGLPNTAQACPAYLGCGCNLSVYLLGKAERSLWLARNWLRLGTSAPHGCVDCVAVFSRGRGGHVGIVRSWNGSNPVVYSWGNRRIGWYTAEYSAKRILGLRYVNRSYARTVARVVFDRAQGTW